MQLGRYMQLYRVELMLIHLRQILQWINSDCILAASLHYSTYLDYCEGPFSNRQSSMARFFGETEVRHASYTDFGWGSTGLEYSEAGEVGGANHYSRIETER